MAGKSLRHNMAKVEFLGSLEKIESMLQQGFSKRMVYEKLFSGKRLSMAYVTFCKLAVRYVKSSSATSQLNTAPLITTSGYPPAQTSKPVPSSGTRIVNTAKEPFPDPRKMSLEDGI